MAEQNGVQGFQFNTLDDGAALNNVSTENQGDGLATLVEQ